MKNLIKFELRKIMTNRFSQIAVAAVLLLSVIISFSTLANMYAFDGKNNHGTGKAAVKIDKSVAAEYEGVLTDKKVQQMMDDFKPTQDLHGMNAKYLIQNAEQSAIFAHFSDAKGNWNGQHVSDVFGKGKIQIGYVNGWLHTSQNMTMLFLVLSVVIILIIAPVFCGEYSGVDNIILTSKYGKEKCATAKVIASLISTLLVTLFIAAINLIIAIIIYGTDGLHCSVLFASQDFERGYLPFNITCLTALIYQIILAFTSAVSVTGITLIFSSVCKNQMIAFAASVSIYVLPFLLPISEKNPLYKIIVLLPSYYSQYFSLMSVKQMGGGMLYAVWAVPVAFGLMVIGVIVSRICFIKHQVS